MNIVSVRKYSFGTVAVFAEIKCHNLVTTGGARDDISPMV
jgi:hypothetical protein